MEPIWRYFTPAGKKTQEGRSCSRAWMTLIVLIVERHHREQYFTSFSSAEARDWAEDIFNWVSFLLWYLKDDCLFSFHKMFIESPQNWQHQGYWEPTQPKAKVSPKVDYCPCQSLFANFLRQIPNSSFYWRQFSIIHISL